MSINSGRGRVYIGAKIEKIVLEAIYHYLDEIKKTPKDKALKIRYKKELAEKRKEKREFTDKKEHLNKRLTELSLEVACI